ncbi:hypothetical protein KCTC32420_00368 [Aequorivita nionensis]
MLFCFRFSPTIVEDIFNNSEFKILNSELHYTLISTSTPLGNSNFIRASIVFEEEL